MRSRATSIVNSYFTSETFNAVSNRVAYTYVQSQPRFALSIKVDCCVIPSLHDCTRTYVQSQPRFVLSIKVDCCVIPSLHNRTHIRNPTCRSTCSYVSARPMSIRFCMQACISVLPLYGTFIIGYPILHTWCRSA